ncbi:MAG: cation transporter [Oligoflexales bacterium]|nr:cation transporter [Oligoflexales bacterium]
MSKTHKTSQPDQVLATVTGISFFLAIAKLVVYLSTGSMLVLASCLDSLADSTTSFLNRYLSKKSLEKPDKEHPFGHGGFEVFGSFVQGVVVAFLGAHLLLESMRKLWHGHSEEFGHLPLAAIALALSALGSLVIDFFFSYKLKKMRQRKERSLTLLSDKAHYKGDFWTNSLACLGVVLVYLTGISYLDSILGIISACLWISTSVPILHKAFKDIVHSEAPAEFQQEIVDLVLGVDPRIKGIHLFRSREFGPFLFVDFHMQVSEHLSLKEAHTLSDRVEETIKKTFGRADVLIHLDPADEPEERPWDPSYKIV